MIYLIECKTCGKLYIGSTERPFRARFNNYRSAQRNFEKGKKVFLKKVITEKRTGS